MSKRIFTPLFILIIIIYCAYLGLIIYRSSSVIDGQRFFVLTDDAMISMRYAKNLADGYGLVFNPGGEKVEGYSNPLWVLYMSLFHLLPIAASKISLFIQISGALFLIINLFFIRKITNLICDNSSFASLSAVFLTAFYMPFSRWAVTGGMETSIQILLISLSVYEAFKYIKTDKFSVRLPLLLGISTLIRFDMLVISSTILFCLISKQRGKNIMLSFGIILIFIITQILFRFLYYGEILPNTYYLIMTGWPSELDRISRGLSITSGLLKQMAWILFFVPLTILIFKRNRMILLLFCVFTAQLAYNIYVGGDSLVRQNLLGVNRYLSVVMPVFFILFCSAMSEFRLFLLSKTTKIKLLNPAISIFSVCLIFTAFIKINTARYIINIIKRSDPVVTASQVGSFSSRDRIKTGLFLNKITHPESKIGVYPAGVIPYFSDRHTIDFWGVNDKKIARGKTAGALHGPSGYIPGHAKRDLLYSIGELKPDVVILEYSGIIQQVTNNALQTEILFGISYKKCGVGLYARSDSLYIYWEKLQQLSTIPAKEPSNPNAPPTPTPDTPK